MASAADLMGSLRQTRVDDEVEEKEARRGLISWDAVRWLSGHAAQGSPTKQRQSKPVESLTAGKEAAAGNGSMLFAGAAAALAAKSSATAGLGGLFGSLLNPTAALPTPSQQSGEGTEGMLATYSHLVFLRATCRIIFRVIVLVRIARFRDSATPISALVLNELLG